jgi:hypothetical protein
MFECTVWSSNFASIVAGYQNMDVVIPTTWLHEIVEIILMEKRPLAADAPADV